MLVALQHDYSSTQVDLPSPLREDVLRFAASIPDELLSDGGREDRPHATVLYGLHTQDYRDVEALLNLSSIAIELGEISKFELDDEDVIKIDVRSPDLHALNALLRQLPHTLSFPDYQPHVTLAYVKPRAGDYLLGNRTFVGRRASVRSVLFSSKNDHTALLELNPVMFAVAQIAEEELRAREGQAFALELLAGFDPGQERDENGRWTNTGSDEGNSAEIIKQQRPFIESWQKKYGGLYEDWKVKNTDEYIKKANATLQKLVPGSNVFIRMNVGNLNAVLSSGEIKNAFETQTSKGATTVSGSIDYERRRYVEEGLLGTERNAPGEERVKYGYLSSGDGISELSPYVLKGAGGVAIKLKDDVKERTTFTVGDSLDSAVTLMPQGLGGGWLRGATFQPQPMLKPSLAAVPNGILDQTDLKRVEDLSRDYVEAQIGKRITLSDIASITFDKKPGVALTNRLKRFKIPYKVARRIRGAAKTPLWKKTQAVADQHLTSYERVFGRAFNSTRRKLSIPELLNALRDKSIAAVMSSVEPAIQSMEEELSEELEDRLLDTLNDGAETALDDILGGFDYEGITTAEFNPDQPRDEAGRWTGGTALGKELSEKTWLHGSGAVFEGPLRDPLFLTTDPKGAEWFSRERGEKPSIQEIRVRVKNPFHIKDAASARELASLMNNAGLEVAFTDSPEGWSWEAKIDSSYDGTNPMDIVYSARAREALQAAGYDALYSHADPLESGEIDALVPLDAAKQVIPVRFLAGYDPSQERDGHGRWVEIGADETKPAIEYGFQNDDAPRKLSDDPDSPEWKAMESHGKFFEELEQEADDRPGENNEVKQMLDSLDRYRRGDYQAINRIASQTDALDDTEAWFERKRDEYDVETNEELFTNSDASNDDDIGYVLAAEKLSQLISESPALKEPVTVYRGLNSSTLQTFEPGDVVQLNGFQSASFEPKVAMSFSKNNGAILEIRATDGLALGTDHSINGEMEFVMDHGQHYKVVGVKEMELSKREWSDIGDPLDLPKAPPERRRVVQLVQLPLAKKIEAAK